MAYIGYFVYICGELSKYKKMIKNLFSSESVSEGHPDKVADQISDALLDAYLLEDNDSHVAIETLVTTGQVIVAGEVKSAAVVDVQSVVRNTIRKIGYNRSELLFDADSCGILNAIHTQSPDIDRGTTSTLGKRQGAGDQGMMFGYATNETETFMPLEHYLATQIVMTLAEIRNEGMVMRYLRPDSKSQVTVEYEEGKPKRIDTIVVSTQHDEFASERTMQQLILHDVKRIVIPRMLAKINKQEVRDLFGNDIIYHVNPTGKFVIGGPAGDTGLTGRKIIVDTYGGRASHGGGAFSGKSPDKVDRSAAYAARYIAKNLVAHGYADKIQIQLAYAIGVAEPVSVCVDTFGTGNISDEQISEIVMQKFDLTPYGIEQMLHLKKPIYQPTAAYGHFGRESYTKRYLTFFPWEKIISEEEWKR